MIHRLFTVKRWRKNGNGNGHVRVIVTENQTPQLPEPPAPPREPWLARLDEARVPRTLNYPSTTLGRILDQSADRFPQSTALHYNDYHCTYRELLAQVNRLAGGLPALGVGPADRASAPLPNCPEFF